MNKNVTKNEIVDNIYNTLNKENSDCNKVDRQQIQSVINEFIVELKKSLGEGKSIELRGLGTFEPKLRNERPARNPKTGEKVVIKPHYVAVFRPGKELQDSLKVDLTNKLLDLNPDEK